MKKNFLVKILMAVCFTLLSTIPAGAVPVELTGAFWDLNAQVAVDREGGSWGDTRTSTSNTGPPGALDSSGGVQAMYQDGPFPNAPGLYPPEVSPALRAFANYSVINAPGYKEVKAGVNVVGADFPSPPYGPEWNGYAIPDPAYIEGTEAERAASWARGVSGSFMGSLDLSFSVMMEYYSDPAVFEVAVGVIDLMDPLNPIEMASASYITDGPFSTVGTGWDPAAPPWYFSYSASWALDAGREYIMYIDTRAEITGDMNSTGEMFSSVTVSEIFADAPGGTGPGPGPVPEPATMLLLGSGLLGLAGVRRKMIKGDGSHPIP